MSLLDLRFTIADADAAIKEWGFNCGPAAICALVGMTPKQIRPHLADFERRGHMNPTQVARALRSIGVTFRRIYEYCDPVVDRPLPAEWPNPGLVRIQWGGTYCKPGVPMAARYPFTHWIAAYGAPIGFPPTPQPMGVYDVNVGAWISFEVWAARIAPRLARHPGKRADGTWWPTHCWEIGPAPASQK